MISTLNKAVLTPAEKKEKITAHQKFHSALLEQYEVPEKDFNVKLVFTHAGVRIVGIFPNEFTKKNGFFIEFVDGKLDPTDPSRKLYRLTSRENFEDVYPLLSSGSYAVPIEELELVAPIKKIAPEFNLEAPRENKSDEHYSKLTIRDLAAILWQSPVSDKEWLNTLVNQVKQGEI